MLYNHTDLILGHWEDLELDGDRWLANAVFDDDEESQKYAKKVEKGSIKMASVKAEIIEAMIVVEDGVEIIHATKWKAIEASLVPVGGNDNALSLTYEGEEITTDKLFIKLSKSKSDINFKINKMKKVAVTLGLQESAAEDALVQAIEAMKKDASEASNLKTKNIQLAKDLNDANAKLEALKSKALEDKATSLVENALNAKKIGASEKEAYIKLAKADYDSTKAILDAKQGHVSLSAFAANGAAASDPEKYKGWDFQKYQKEDPIELSRIRTEEPEKFKELLKTLKS